MPRHPTSRQVQVVDDASIDDKQKWMKALMNLHIGEVRETWGEWHLVSRPLPQRRLDSPWYHPQIQDNAFLAPCNEKSKHWCRTSWGRTLPSLMKQCAHACMMGKHAADPTTSMPCKKHMHDG